LDEVAFFATAFLVAEVFVVEVFFLLAEDALVPDDASFSLIRAAFQVILLEV
jgi:hypothetical protein